MEEIDPTVSVFLAVKHILAVLQPLVWLQRDAFSLCDWLFSHLHQWPWYDANFMESSYIWGARPTFFNLISIYLSWVSNWHRERLQWSLWTLFTQNVVLYWMWLCNTKQPLTATFNNNSLHPLARVLMRSYSSFGHCGLILKNKNKTNKKNPHMLSM